MLEGLINIFLFIFFLLSRIPWKQTFIIISDQIYVQILWRHNTQYCYLNIGHHAIICIEMQHRTVQAVSGISGYLSSLAEDNPRLSSHLNKKKHKKRCKSFPENCLNIFYLDVIVSLVNCVPVFPVWPYHGQCTVLPVHWENHYENILNRLNGVIICILIFSPLWGPFHIPTDRLSICQHL